MLHPYKELKLEYDSLLSTVVVERAAAADAAAARLLRTISRYAAVQAATGVPSLMLAGLHNRESDADFTTYLGNGEPLSRVTRLVPRGRGPFLPPDAWVKGAIDAVRYDRLDVATAPWDMSYACWKGEGWNGFGPRAHGIHTGYLWAGTNHYQRGKYVADGKWDANHEDKQLGMIPVMLALAHRLPGLALLTSAPEGAVVDLEPMAPPVGVGGALWVQESLNALGWHLREDDSYGRRTREAVRAFQTKNNVRPFDGLCGPVTIKAIQVALDRR